MNLILFDASELSGASCLLPRTDPRAEHVLRILRLGPGDSFEAGLIDGPRGAGTLQDISDGTLRLSFVWGETLPHPANLTLVIGLPRPQTARKLLREVTALGVAAMHFVHTDLGEPGYARSPLWSTQEWRRHLIDGTQQAFDTHLPSVTVGRTLQETLVSLPAGGGTRLALDHETGASPLGAATVTLPAVLALGPERGWSDAERALLHTHGFEFVHLGPRILRVETACVAAVALVRARLGLM